MEEKTRSVSSNALYYGLITGAAMILYGLVMFLLNQHLNKTLGYVGYVFLVGGMIWGTLEYRKTYAGGFIPYGKAFKSCFMIGLFAGILSAIYMFIFAQFIHPGLMNEILDASRQTMMTDYPNMSDEQMEQALAISAKFMNPWMLAIIAFLSHLVIAAIVSLILALLLKKEDKSLASPVQ